MLVCDFLLYEFSAIFVLYVDFVMTWFVLVFVSSLFIRLKVIDNIIQLFIYFFKN